MADNSIFLIIFLTLTWYLLIRPCYSETDTLQQGQELKDWDYLISSNKVFTLKFFSFDTSISPYLGVFYNPRRSKIYGRYDDLYNKNPKTIRCTGCCAGFDDIYDLKDRAVWVTNRNNPITDMYGKLMIDVYGKLCILSSGVSVVDLVSPTPVARNASGTLLDNGNFILQELYPDGI
ncbi:unnamed protein product [Lactuca saligna]|uniref:Bulb-type lectin domain-containing protein n=1 Tax=Lactuca saligna TaxID=75948 RepID=A0AA35VDP5_LACSI|nr:unnamed protein product [Lactuca saligna]